MSFELTLVSHILELSLLEFESGKVHPAARLPVFTLAGVSNNGGESGHHSSLALKGDTVAVHLFSNIGSKIFLLDWRSGILEVSPANTNNEVVYPSDSFNPANSVTKQGHL